MKALRKPTVAAAAVNRLSRSRSKDVESLLAAGEELQAAQEDLLAGGDRSAFQLAAARERELVSDLAAGAGAGLEEKVAATLHAAALDPDVAEELRAGRLVREREAVGGFGVGAVEAQETGPARSPRPQRARPTASKPKPAETKPAKSKPRDDSARRERLAAARGEERRARKELEAAAKAHRSALERAEAARAHAAEAAKRAKTTAARLSEAKQAEAAAKKGHSKAAAALKRAEAAAK